MALYTGNVLSTWTANIHRQYSRTMQHCVRLVSNNLEGLIRKSAEESESVDT
ncbi:hypothetical protein KIN20_004572 [Parelaphostrongylus tenuis]|uniref:Uncharacterized protein n=1 Tax=Parelaphostrongylus tenuis TaxID=148309 RepID=A0AAD5QJF4_PARTN|nr:hypothetical protein KIN20_004572 [Parelaphostrongylus tenuis]